MVVADELDMVTWRREGAICVDLGLIEDEAEPDEEGGAAAVHVALERVLGDGGAPA